VKKGLQAKQQLVEEIRKNVGVYKRIFVFTTHNMRNSKIKDLRGDWKDSR
jgi:mRNA turnover protein 4